MTSEKAVLTEQRLNDWIAGGYDPVAGPPTIETWHSLGSLSGFTIGVARYRMTADGEVEFDIDVDGNATHANSVNFGTTLPTAYRPSLNRHLPLARTGNIGAALTDQASRIFISTAGVVTVLTPTNDTASFGTVLRMPL